jgi:hypothetical protein
MYYDMLSSSLNDIAKKFADCDPFGISAEWSTGLYIGLAGFLLIVFFGIIALIAVAAGKAVKSAKTFKAHKENLEKTVGLFDDFETEKVDTVYKSISTVIVSRNAQIDTPTQTGWSKFMAEKKGFPSSYFDVGAIVNCKNVKPQKSGGRTFFGIFATLTVLIAAIAVVLLAREYTDTINVILAAIAAVAIPLVAALVIFLPIIKAVENKKVVALEDSVVAYLKYLDDNCLLFIDDEPEQELISDTDNEIEAFLSDEDDDEDESLEENIDEPEASNADVVEDEVPATEIDPIDALLAEEGVKVVALAAKEEEEVVTEEEEEIDEPEDEDDYIEEDYDYIEDDDSITTDQVVAIVKAIVQELKDAPKAVPVEEKAAEPAAEPVTIINVTYDFVQEAAPVVEEKPEPEPVKPTKKAKKVVEEVVEEEPVVVIEQETTQLSEEERVQNEAIDAEKDAILTQEINETIEAINDAGGQDGFSAGLLELVGIMDATISDDITTKEDLITILELLYVAKEEVIPKESELEQKIIRSCMNILINEHDRRSRWRRK